MSTELRIPAAGDSVQEVQIVEWTVDSGTPVSEGQVIYTVESDKSVLEIEAPASGTLTIIASAGETYPVGHLIGRIDG
ncbi:MAG: lipoyl domain-containing protein [Novosphingobium sp.]|nr:lipoyl domain-containing protein [Novosphingobium sp.]